MDETCRLIDHYLPPGDGFVLESLLATTYKVDFEFLEEELLPVAFGVRSPVSRFKAFRSELERCLQGAEVSILYDLGGCDRMARLSPRIDALPVSSRKLHSKISLLMWVREDRAAAGAPERCMRLLVGSANLTRQGFRQNYECVASLDSWGRNPCSPALFDSAVEQVRRIAAGMNSPQLDRQLRAFSALAARSPAPQRAVDEPLALVSASQVVPVLRETWRSISAEAPARVTVVSPFWPQGPSASRTLSGLFHQLGPSADIELVCRGDRSTEGWLLPVFDGSLAADLVQQLGRRLWLRAAQPVEPGGPIAPVEPLEAGDETEEREFATRLDGGNAGSETVRALHAKMIFLDGPAGSALYAGSSNCTCRGLGLGGPSNFEAGFVYRLTPRQRAKVAGLLGFAGDPVEVLPDCIPPTVQPIREEDGPVPTFLEEVVAAETVVSIRFRQDPPSDLVLLMPVPARAADPGYWVLFQADPRQSGPRTIRADLRSCRRCDGQLQPLAGAPAEKGPQPHVLVEVRWAGHSATYPVRFDDKARLPLFLDGRRPTEGELIEYFLFGKEPGTGDGSNDGNGEGAERAGRDGPIDTRGILAYFIRRFVQSIPGIEAEILRAGHSPSALESALRGPTSPLELAERAFTSVDPDRKPSVGEPVKTAIAAGFQLVEIIAALNRSRAGISDPELRPCFDPVIWRCGELLEALTARSDDLQTSGFRSYRARLLGGTR